MFAASYLFIRTGVTQQAFIGWIKNPPNPGKGVLPRNKLLASPLLGMSQMHHTKRREADGEGQHFCSSIPMTFLKSKTPGRGQIPQGRLWPQASLRELPKKLNHTSTYNALVCY